MDRIMFEIGNFKLYWYSFFILVGMITAVTLGYLETKRQKININFYTNLAFYIIIFGILGARIYYILFNLDYYLAYPVEIIKVWNGGLAIHGGIIVGILVTIIYCKKYKVNIFKMLDIASVSVIIAQAIGRWGNFFNQEAFGQIATKAKLASLKIPEFIINGMYINGNYYHPTFLYESIWDLFGFIVLIIFRRRRYLKIGELTCIYLIWYSIGRFFIESMRTDSLMFGQVKVAQVVSLLLIVIGLVILIIRKKGSKLDNLYNSGEKYEIKF